MSHCRHQNPCYTSFSDNVHVHICDCTIYILYINLSRKQTKTLKMHQQAYSTEAISDPHDVSNILDGAMILTHNFANILGLMKGRPDLSLFFSDIVGILKLKCHSKLLVWLIA